MKRLVDLGFEQKEVDDLTSNLENMMWILNKMG